VKSSTYLFFGRESQNLSPHDNIIALNTQPKASKVFSMLANFVVVTSLHSCVIFDTTLWGGLAVNISLLIRRVSVNKQARKAMKLNLHVKNPRQFTDFRPRCVRFSVVFCNLDGFYSFDVLSERRRK
jgi:hypothetical protein